jgi:hypothetical protein
LRGCGRSARAGISPGTGDFNGNGKTDILWRNDGGAVATWDMDDHSFTGAVIATGPNDWHIV